MRSATSSASTNRADSRSGRSAPRSRPTRHAAWRDAALVALAAILVYAATARYPLVYDDLELIPHQEAIRNPGSLDAIATGRYWGDLREHDTLYRPLTIWTLAVNHGLNEITGHDVDDPAGFRVVNILLNAAVSALLLFFFRSAGLPRRAAFAAALIFAVHPIHSEVVDAVVNRSESLAALFGFGFLLLLRAGGGTRPRPDAWRVTAAGAALFFALAAKESAIAFIVIAIWMDVVLGTGRLRARVTARLRERAAMYGAAAAALALWFALRASAIHGITQRTMPVDNPLVTAPFASRILTAGAVGARYLALLVAPIRLSSDYSMNQVPVVSSPFDPWFLAFVAAMVIGVAAAWRLRTRAPLVAFGLGSGVVASLPAANIVFPTGTIMAERLVYAPSAFLLLAIAALPGLGDARGDRADATATPPRASAALPAARARTALVALIILLLAARTVERNRSWRNPDVFYETQAHTAPLSAKAHYSWGKRLLLAGRTDEALRENQRAVDLLPAYPDAWNNLAAALEKKGDSTAALDAYRRADSIPPGHAQAAFNIGRFAYAHGDVSGAISAYRRAVALDPRYLDAWNNLGIALAESGQRAGARDAWRRALAIDPAFRAARENLEILDAPDASNVVR